MNEKSQLLEEVEEVFIPTKQLDLRFLASILLIMALVFSFLFPKIYLQNQIYYKSRDISVLKREYDALKEENRIIKTKVEGMKFKNQILDTLF